MRVTARTIDDADRTCKGATVITASGMECKFYAPAKYPLPGCLESPKLLILSGVGSARESAEHGINVIDHPDVPFVLRVRGGFGMDDVFLLSPPTREDSASS